VDPYQAGADEVRLVRRGHLLLAAANALQPGVFSLSSWDLVGALPIPEETVKDRTADGDYRWVNRGGVDLMGANPNAKASAFGVARAKTLYGSLPEQLKERDSFASQLKRMLEARRKARLAEGELIEVPEPEATALCVLVLRLPEKGLAVTVLNFGRKEVEEVFRLGEVVKGMGEREWTDILTGRGAGGADRLRVRLDGLSGTTFVLAERDR
jgi:maltose alpha-D-glucosyltransferase/alpha-amylase